MTETAASDVPRGRARSRSGCAGAVCLVLAACATASGHLETGVVFTRYTPLASNAEIVRRVLPPLTYRRVQEALAARRQQLADQAIDLAKERFDVYVPDAPPPPAGYGLVVFVAPWDDPTKPRTWQLPLDRHGLVFVSARNSGNDQPVLDRRLPLALLAYENVRARYPIDARRVYVMGFSGGGRVAERAALAYPDVFRGAILAAGTDPIDGSAGVYKPRAELFRQFQRSRLVLVTGDQDWDIQHDDELALRALRAACVLGVTTESFHGGHVAVDMRALDRALDDVEAPPALDERELARCNARVDQAIAARLAAAAATLVRGDREGARRQLKTIEAEFGGLAAAGLLALDARLGS